MVLCVFWGVFQMVDHNSYDVVKQFNCFFFQNPPIKPKTIFFLIKYLNGKLNDGPPKEIHILILRTCESVSLSGTGAL